MTFERFQPTTPQDSTAFGKEQRKRVPRSSQGVWSPVENRINPVDLLKSQESSRVAELLPIRYARMGVSPFTFFRGGALVMANDLSTEPESGIPVQACGDCHIANFGIYSSPERRLVFDINDFDETLRGPWEWDVKRMAASIEICGRDCGFNERDIRAGVMDSIRSYRETMLELSEKNNLDVWYAQESVEDWIAKMNAIDDKSMTNRVEKTMSKALKKTSVRAVSKFTEIVDGKRRIIDQSPIVTPIRALEIPGEADRVREILSKMFSQYKDTLAPERRHLLDQYRYVDSARKVVGVGSVGTRCWIVVFQGRDENDPLVLQIKEAQDSVMERYIGRSPLEQNGQRVVEGQRLMQTSSDILLGWVRGANLQGSTSDYYIRQLWDGKGSVSLDFRKEQGLSHYANLCAATLARSHARTGNRFAISGYLGEGDKFDQAMAEFAYSYAEQNEVDYDVFMNALADGNGTL